VFRASFVRLWKGAWLELTNYNALNWPEFVRNDSRSMGDSILPKPAPVLHRDDD
jgi:hypothetical protein